MKTALRTTLFLFILAFGSLQTASAQDLQTMEKNLSAISDELNQKTKDFSWQLLSAYADYCEANDKYISWNDVPYLQKVIEFERPESLEPLRLESKALADEIQTFLNGYREYRELKKKQSEAVSKEEKDANSAAFRDFWKILREKETEYRELYYAERRARCKYRAEVLRYMIADYKGKNQVVPINFIEYSDRSYLLQKGSKLELLQKEINTLESVQRELVRNITRAKYGLKDE